MVIVSGDKEMHYLVLFCDLLQEGIDMNSEEMIQGFCNKYLGVKNGIAWACSNTQCSCNGMLFQRNSLKCDLEDRP